MIRLNEAQYRKVKKLTRRLCANNDGGCCLLLDDGDPCVCVQAMTHAKNVNCAASRSTPAAIAPNTATPAQYWQHGGWLVNASAVNAKETQK